MATTTRTIAAPINNNPQRSARAAENAKMHSILAAAIGLTTLNTSSPDQSILSHSSPEQDFNNPSPMTLNPALTSSADLDHSMMDFASARQHAASAQYLRNQQAQVQAQARAPYQASAPYPALSSVGVGPARQQSALNVNTTCSPSWMSSIRSQQVPGFDSLPHMSLNPPGPSSLSSAAMSMDRFSLADRVAALDRANASASAALHPSSYPYNSFAPYHQAYGPGGLNHLPVAPSIPNTKNFPETLFDIVSMDEHSHIASWLPHGKGFIIHDKQRFANLILPRFFDGAKFTSFTRRLKRWSFVRVPRGPELGAYYNKNFMRDQPELVLKMRYRMDGQFEEGKKKNGGEDDKDVKKEEDSKDKEDMNTEALKEEINKEVERKVEESLPKKMDQVKESPPSPTSAQISSLEFSKPYLADPRERPMPLPSTLPKRPKASTAGKVNQRARTSSESLMSLTAKASESAMLSRGYPSLVTPNDPTEQRLAEIQREMLLARSMMPRETLGLPRTGSSNHINNGLPPSSLSTMGSNSMPSQQPYYNNTSNTTSNTNTLGRLEAERAQRFLEAERILSNQGATPARILSSSKTQEETMVDAAIQDLKSKLAPPFMTEQQHHSQHHRQQQRRSSFVIRGSSGSQGSARQNDNMAPSMSYENLENTSKSRFSANELNMARNAIRQTQNSGSERSIIMSHEQEREFAEYLFLKRESINALRGRPQRNS